MTIYVFFRDSIELVISVQDYLKYLHLGTRPRIYLDENIFSTVNGKLLLVLDDYNFVLKGIFEMFANVVVF
jgi:hypothetical protein